MANIKSTDFLRSFSPTFYHDANNIAQASELAQAKNDHAQLAALRSEMAEQEARWKESYDLLLAENEKLKSSGAEALLAAQWRHRYEACLREKEGAMTNLEMEREKVFELQDQRKKMDSGKYESKYRDLKVRQ